MKQKLRIAGKPISLFAADDPAPLVYLHSFMPNWDMVWHACRQLDCPPFSLAIISGLTWDDEMTPWPIPPIAPGDTPCGGTADTYLNTLTDEILPAVESKLSAPPTWRGLAGYSLSGLFALYAPFKTDKFERVASASGSVWYPDFTDWVTEHQMVRAPKCVYLSLGDREARTRNPYLKPVQDRTEWMKNYYKNQNIPCVFELNPGNHDRNATGRMARGITWIVSQHGS